MVDFCDVDDCRCSVSKDGVKAGEIIKSGNRFFYSEDGTKQKTYLRGAESIKDACLMLKERENSLDYYKRKEADAARIESEKKLEELKALVKLEPKSGHMALQFNITIEKLVIKTFNAAH